MTTSEEKLDLMSVLQEVAGSIPPGTTKLLNLLVHPDVIKYTRRYISAQDQTRDLACSIFGYPWDCFKEAEAKYENLRHGWGGAGDNPEFENWCEPCRVRAGVEGF